MTDEEKTSDDVIGAAESEPAEALLSDDEKDALMAGMDAGVIGDGTTQADATDVRRFELRPDAYINYGSLPRLQGICQEIAKRLAVEWSSMVRGPVSVNAEESFSTTYGVAIQKLLAPVLTTSLSMSPMPEHTVLVFDNALLKALVESFFGFITGDAGVDSAESAAVRAPFTAGELRVGQIAIDRFLRTLAPAWEKVVAVKPSFVKTEFDPTFGVDVSPKDVVVVCRFLIQTGMHHGYLYLILPRTQIAAIADDLEGAVNARNELGDPVWKKNIQVQLQDTSLNADILVGDIRLPLRDVISLEVGQVLALDDPEVADMHVEGVRRAMGRFGTNDKFNAFRLVEWLPPSA
ncbi:MAG: flagellar motor switch protein FliM [Woeseiaceae bacterium]